MKFMNYIAGFILLFLGSYAHAQGDCGTQMTAEFGNYFYNKDFSNLENYADGRRAATVYVPVQYHLLANDDGSTAYTLRDLLTIHCQINQNFASADIQFFMINLPHRINNTRFNQMSDNAVDNDMKSANNVANACNVYIVSNARSSGTTVCGYATFPGWGMQGIVLDKGCSEPENTTYTHEMGHFLGLPHTFETWGGVERCNGSNCSSAGDRFCDTPCDFLSDRWSCPYTGNETDPNGLFYRDYIDPSLYMCYSSDVCMSRFSTQQKAYMYDTRLTDRASMNLVPIPYTGSLSATNLLLPADGTIKMANTVTLSWNKVSNATYYHVVLGTNSGLNIGVVKDTMISDTNITVSDLAINRDYFWHVKPITLYNSCEDFSSVFTFKTGEISATANITNPTCNGKNNGNVEITPSLGTPPYSYLWSTGSVVNPSYGLTAGNYTCTVSDLLGRQVIVNVTLNDPPPINANFYYYGTSGIYVEANGGTEPYNYQWSNGVNSYINTSLSPGSYTVTITDANSCSTVANFTATSIEDNNHLFDVNLYPNPAKDGQNVILEVNANVFTSARVQLLSVDGKIMFSKSLKLNSGYNQEVIPTENIPSGIYVIQLSTDEGMLVNTKKLSIF